MQGERDLDLDDADLDADEREFLNELRMSAGNYDLSLTIPEDSVPEHGAGESAPGSPAATSGDSLHRASSRRGSHRGRGGRGAGLSREASARVSTNSAKSSASSYQDLGIAPFLEQGMEQIDVRRAEIEVEAIPSQGTDAEKQSTSTDTRDFSYVQLVDSEEFWAERALEMLKRDRERSCGATLRTFPTRESQSASSRAGLGPGLDEAGRRRGSTAVRSVRGSLRTKLQRWRTPGGASGAASAHYTAGGLQRQSSQSLGGLEDQWDQRLSCEDFYGRESQSIGAVAALSVADRVRVLTSGDTRLLGKYPALKPFENMPAHVAEVLVRADDERKRMISEEKLALELQRKADLVQVNQEIHQRVEELVRAELERQEQEEQQFERQDMALEDHPRFAAGSGHGNSQDRASVPGGLGIGAPGAEAAAKTSRMSPEPAGPGVAQPATDAGDGPGRELDPGPDAAAKVRDTDRPRAEAPQSEQQWTTEKKESKRAAGAPADAKRGR